MQKWGQVLHRALECNIQDLIPIFGNRAASVAPTDRALISQILQCATEVFSGRQLQLLP